MDCPDQYIKGIPNDQFYQNGHLSGHLFEFNPQFNRDDGWCEQSVNWYDDDQAVTCTLEQKKEDQFQFKTGYAILPTSEIDRLNTQPSISNALSYERSPLDDNPYHGNLLIKNDVPKSKRKMISAAIALTYTKIIERKILT